jgi:ADP-ribose pyrophosphatase
MDPPRIVSTRVVYENRWMRLHEDRTESADGREGLYAWLEKPPAAVILPIDGGDVWLVEQFRHPPKARFWEFPQGAWEDAPSAAPEELARGELVEETGLRAGRIERLGQLFSA